MMNDYAHRAKQLNAIFERFDCQSHIPGEVFFEIAPVFLRRSCAKSPNAIPQALKTVKNRTAAAIRS